MEKEINVNDVVKYLSRAFSKATAKAADVIGTQAFRMKNKDTNEYETSLLYDYQVEFCYLIDDIQRGPKYIVAKKIQMANELIAEIENLTKESE